MPKNSTKSLSDAEVKARENAKKAERAAYMKLTPEQKTAYNRKVKADTLVKLANRRVTAAVAKIGLIGNLATYRPTSEQINKIMTALGESCARVQNRLEGTRTESVTFTLTQ